MHKADERLEDHDLLDMVNVGVIPAVIVDSHKAELWAQVFENIKVHENLAVHTNSSIAWAMRKNSPKLTKAVNDFVKTHAKGTLTGNVLFNRYLKNTKWMDNALTSEARERFEATVDIMKRYSDRYDFDWLMIAAQGLSEFADGDNAKLIRKENGVDEAYTIKLDSLIRDGDITMNRAVLPGDTIIIPESSF